MSEKMASAEYRAVDQHVVDTDFHLHMPVENLFEYVDDELLQETMETLGAPPTVSSGSNIEYSSGVPRPTRHSRSQGSAGDRDEIHDVMEEWGLNEVIVTPGTHLPFNSGRYPAAKHALIRAYNDYLIDKVIDVDRGIYGTIAIPPDPAVAVAEIERLESRDGFVGVQREFSLSRPMGHTTFDPVYDALTASDLPLLLHIGNPRIDRFSLVGDTMRTYVGSVLSGTSYALFANVMNMIMTGVFDKYPDLDVVLQEAGTNWIPYLTLRGDEMYQSYEEDAKLSERMHEMGQEYLDRLPSEYVFDNMYVTTQPIALPDRKDLRDPLLELCHAEETFMFATDWPHHTVDVPKWVADSRLDEDLQARIFRESAQDVLQLP